MLNVRERRVVIFDDVLKGGLNGMDRTGIWNKEKDIVTGVKYVKASRAT